MTTETSQPSLWCRLHRGCIDKFVTDGGKAIDALRNVFMDWAGEFRILRAGRIAAKRR
jgi:hypothetical protein